MLLGVVTILIWRRMEHCRPIRISLKTLLVAAVAIAGTLALGIGMCFSMVWNQMAVGIVMGFVGILALLCLVPLVKGIKE